MMRTFTNNPVHIAVMEKMLVNDTVKVDPKAPTVALDSTSIDKLTKEEVAKLVPMTITRTIVTYTDEVTKEKITIGDGMEYTVLKRFPNFNEEPNEVQ